MTHDRAPVTPEAMAQEIKRCCAAAYSSDVVALVLGDSFHPGGPALTRRLADRLALSPGMRVLDVACGRGTSALLLAKEYGVHVDGADLGADNLERARTAAQQQGVGHLTAFHLADAEKLPFPDGCFDAVICECAFCTFPDKLTAAREFARVLRPGGRVGITDITMATDRLPDELADLAGWVACLADARPIDTYTHLLAQAGLTAGLTEEHDQALAEMIDQVEARLRVLRMASTGLDLTRALQLTRSAAGAVRDGVAGYCLIVASR
ncbi:class I SAM-dependent methyltransferase [Nonomuraea sp. 10N515B]|uniref:class I SAM-dependent methyltransferase n=1 Tax=Nonomuraea sp. 10N515B TaxID=3457422 RepID=UPI003FCE5312